MDDRRLTDIESKLSHQENLVSELNDVITDQQAQISALERRLQQLLDHVRSLPETAGRIGSDDERPPHY